MARLVDNLLKLKVAAEHAATAGNTAALATSLPALLAQPLGFPMLLSALGGLGTWQAARAIQNHAAKRDEASQLEILRAMARDALGPDALEDPDALDRALDRFKDDPDRQPFVMMLKVMTARFDQAQLDREETKVELEKLEQTLERRLPAFIQRYFHRMTHSIHAASRKVEELVNFAGETVAMLKRIEGQWDRDHTPPLATPLEETPEDPRTVEVASTRFVFSSRMTPLLGREDELDLLREFLLEGDPKKHRFKWWIWAGPAGSGKSRLALELVLEMQYRGWRAGFLPDRKNAFGWEAWRPAEPTLVVVDYAARRPLVSKWLDTLHRNAGSFDHRVRFLLLDRTAESNDLWLQMLYGSGTQKTALLKDRYGEPRRLETLSDDALWETVRHVADAMKPGIDIDGERDAVLELLRKTPAGERGDYQRPLYAAFAAETIADRGVQNIRQWSPQDLVESVLGRELIRWKKHELNAKHVNLAALTTLVRGLDSTALDRLRDEHGLGDKIPSQSEYTPSAYHTALGVANAEGKIAPLDPDILGELFVLERLSGKSVLDATANWSANRRGR